MHIRKKIAPLAVSLFLCACAHTTNKVATTAPINWTAQTAKQVVLVEPDVELSELTTGGLEEARADWTSTAREFIRTDVSAALQTKGVTVIPSGTVTDRREAQLVKLHEALGLSIQLNMIRAWPTKKDGFDWTLGPGAAAFRDRYHGDYALFIYVRDSYTTAGRAAMMVAAAVIGVGLPGGQQRGFASLVDLRTGRVVWFNQLASSVGSLKEPKGAADTVKNLLDGIPL